MSNIAVQLLHYFRSPVAQQLDESQAEIEEELRFHLQSRAEELHAEGMTQTDASAKALRQFGDVARITGECQRELSRWQLWIHNAHLIITLALLLLTSGLVFQLLQRPASEPTTTNLDGDVAGLVVDGLGKPLANANVMVAIKWWPANGFRQQCYMTRTDNEGSFSLCDVYPANVEHELQISAVADGHLLTSNYISDQSQPLDTLVLEVARATARMTLEFQTPDGRPIAGVAAFPHRRISESGDDHIVYFQSADRIVQQSDAHGRLQLANFHSGERATFYVRFPSDDDWQTHEIIVENESVVVITPPSTRSESGVAG